MRVYEIAINRFAEIFKTHFSWKWIAAIAGVIIFYFVDVWVLGTTAAAIYDFSIWSNGIKIFATPEQKAAAAAHVKLWPWFSSHPFTVGWAWLTKPTEALSHPEVKNIWMFLNVLLLIAGVGLWIKFRFIKNRKKNNSIDDYRDIEKIKLKKIEYKAINYINKTPVDQIFLGLDDDKKLITIPVEKLKEHVHITGGTGCGKTSLATLPIGIQAIRRGYSHIVIDFKGDKQAIKLLAKEAAENNKKFYFFNLRERDDTPSNTYNPLKYGSVLSKTERIIESLELDMKGDGRYYTLRQQATFIALLNALDQRGVAYNFQSLYDLFRSPDLLENIIGEEVKADELKGLTSALLPYTMLQQINSSCDINLQEIMQCGDVVYFDLASARFPKVAAAIGKMISMELQELAANRSEQSRLCVITIDEFQNMACESFENIISKVRTANYSLILANQAQANLKKISKEFSDEIATNTHTKIFFSFDTPDELDNVSKLAGTVLAETQTQNVGKSKRPGEFFGGTSSNSESTQMVEFPRIHPNVLLRMPEGKSIILRRRHLAVPVNHSHILTLEELKQLNNWPWPEPVKVSQHSCFTVKDLIEEEKQKLICKREPKPKTINISQPDNVNTQQEYMQVKEEIAATSEHVQDENINIQQEEIEL